MDYDFDALIIGGGPAGLSAGMTLGRIGRTALICDDRRPRNAPALQMNNFPGHDGLHPEEWRKQARRDLKKYQTIASFEGTVLDLKKEAQGFTAKLSSGRTVTVRKVLLASGIVDKLPAAPGFQELWGKSIFHCPFCHGFEHRGERLGVVSDGEMALHFLPMIWGLSKDLILFTQGESQLSVQDKNQLRQKNVRIVESKIKNLSYEGEDLKNVICESGEEFARDRLFITPQFPFQHKSLLGESLGCEKTELGLLKVDPRSETSVPGLYAAGDNMTMQQSVLLACAAGVVAGVGMVHALLTEDFSKE